jgi:universal stress protein A
MESKATFRLKKILVPTDFSACSTKALDYDLAFAEQSGAELILLHVVEPAYYPAYGQDIPPDLAEFHQDVQKITQERLDKLSQEKIAGRLPARALVATGNAYEAIVESAKSLEVDLIIIATHGYTGLKHVLLGSMAERVVRHAPCPVLTVREREQEFV